MASTGSNTEFESVTFRNNKIGIWHADLLTFERFMRVGYGCLLRILDVRFAQRCRFSVVRNLSTIPNKQALVY